MWGDQFYTVLAWNTFRMWDTFYWYSAYVQVTLVTGQEIGQVEAISQPVKIH